MIWISQGFSTANNKKLDFTTQNNAVRGEVVVQGTSGNALMRPKSVLVRRALYLKEQGAASFQNLATFKRGVSWVNITPIEIIRTLKYTVRFLCPRLDFTPKYVSARSLRAAGAMTLLCSGVNTDVIKLVGR